jgi:hypothetical protein
MSYLWPGVVVSYISHVYVKKRWIGFWAKVGRNLLSSEYRCTRTVSDIAQYNYVISAAFSSGVAIAAIIIFFALQMQHVSIDWWGNNVVAQGCEDTPCRRVSLADGEYFGPRMGDFH